jgi:DNA-binding YbaB/EbfC family protein
MDLTRMMKQAQKMQKDMQSAQAALAERTVEASAGGGKVKVTATAAGDVTSIRIDPSVVDPSDVEILEDLILTGVRQALAEGRRVSETEMKKITAGMGLPPGMGF